jgi:hypothetical protein
MQTTIPPFARGTLQGWSTITGKEGIGGLYKGLYPLWYVLCCCETLAFCFLLALLSRVELLLNGIP